MIIIRNFSEDGCNLKGFLLRPGRADEHSLNKFVDLYENNKSQWKKNKSVGSFLGMMKTSINGKIAKRELNRRANRQLDSNSFSSLTAVLDKD